MIHYFDWTASSPLVIALCEVVYYGLGVFAGCFVLWQVCRKLVASGHEPASVARFALVCLAVGGPAAYLGYRAGVLAALPSDSWSWTFFSSAPRIDGSHSFDLALLPVFALLSAVTCAFRYRYLHVMDTAFLYVPIAHAITRVGCLLVACCWGETVRLGLPGFGATITNPTPLYSIGLNLLIFALLRQIFRATYRSTESQRRYEGMVLGGYLLLYGAARLVMETFPHQELTLWRLGQTQLLMLVFVVAGSGLLWWIHARPRQAPLVGDVEEDARRTMARLTSILGVAASYLVLIFVFHYLTRRTHILPTPFREADSIGDAWARVLFCVPLVVPALAALFFFRRAGLRVRPYLRWAGASPLFAVALLVSGGYAVYMLAPRGPEPGWIRLGYWPPVIILGTVNAFSEEVIHRLVMLRLLVVSGVAEWGALILQSVLYSLVHFMIAPALGLMALAYGLLLGVVMSRTGSLKACILCHFVIDLGAIGGPLLAG